MYSLPQLKKYIREAGRKLPLYETLFNPQILDCGMGYVIVSRKKPNGDILFAVFLIDIYCLGVKNVFFDLVSPEKYDKIKSDMSENQMSLEAAAPNHIYNIIYGSVEYADTLGLSPHKDFDIAEYILEDVDNVIYEEIVFGLDGKPSYFAGPDDKVSKILATLDKNVGKGNYTYTFFEGQYDDHESLDDDDKDYSFKQDYYFNLFPDHGEKEMRCMIIQDKNHELPMGEYAFLEQYCIDKTCDCRHVNIHVINNKNSKILATINYGWEPLDFYENWSPKDEYIINFKGPALKMEGQQSELSNSLLSSFKFLLQDQSYVKRIEEHYAKVSMKIGRVGY